MSLVNGVEDQPRSEQVVPDSVHDLNALSLSDTVAVPGNEPPTGSLLDIHALSMSQDFDAMINVVKVTTDIPVGRQSNQVFIRTHPDKTYRLLTKVLEDKEARETYVVNPELWPVLSRDLTSKALFTVINRQNTLSLWPIRLPDETGKLDPWNQSALEAAQLAQNHWIRVVSNMAQGSYDVFKAIGDLPEPEWPELSFQEIVDIAFKGKYISNLDHPVLRKLRGEF